ncbi:hypothetical protein ACHAWX_003180 [Stephanocyclus meneghinianus]
MSSPQTTMNVPTATTMNSPISKPAYKEVDTPATAPASDTEEAPEAVDDDEYETAFSKMQSVGPTKKLMRRGKAYGVSALESLTDDVEDGVKNVELDISTFAMDDFREGRKSGFFGNQDLEEWDEDGDSLRDESIASSRARKTVQANDDGDDAGQESDNSDHEGFRGRLKNNFEPASDHESDEEETEFTEASGYGFSQGKVRAGDVAADDEQAIVTMDDAEGDEAGHNDLTTDATDITGQTTQAEAELQEISKSARSAITKPPISDLYSIVDAIFQAADKDNMTVKQVNKSVAAHFGMGKLDKKMKGLIKERLTALVSGEIVVGANDDSDNKGQNSSKSKKEKKSSKKAQNKKNEDDFHGDADLSDEEEAGNDSSSDYDDPATRPSKKKTRKSRKQSRYDESLSDASKNSDAKPNKIRKNRSRSSKSGKMAKHIRDHASKTRLRQLEEARIRQEELGNIACSTKGAKNEEDAPTLSEEDRLRAQAIAARFDTNREEEVLKREEDRVGLIDILRRKRLEIIAFDEDELEVETEVPKDVVRDCDGKTEREKIGKSEVMVDLDDDEEDSSDDEDDELEIIAPSASASASKAKKTSVLDCLFSKPVCSSASRVPRNYISKPVADPRLVLRNALRAKQMKAGNRWLARELGYKTEEDHIRDCLEAELKKRKQILFLEKQAALRDKSEFSVNPAFEVSPDEDDHDSAAASGDEEEDEEVAMARHLEQSDVKFEGVSKVAEQEMSDHDDSGDFDEKDYLNQVDDGLGQLDEWSEPAPIEETSSTPVRPCPSTTGTTLFSPISSSEESHTTQNEQIETDKSACIDANQDNFDQNTSEPTEDKLNSSNSIDGETCFDTIIDTDNVEQDLAESTEAANSSEEMQGKKPIKPKNSAWQALLQKEKESLAKQKKLQKKGGGLVEGEAEEEEEEEGIVGLEDFGFSIEKKKDEDTDDDVEADADDLDHVVDDLSDGEGDEEAGEQARKRLEAREEKERHKEIIRRMREGYDGRRGGIASGIGGARGIHRFDQLVAADNREDAKRLGLLNEDEMDSDEEENDGELKMKKDAPDDEDEAALLDRMLKERFLNRDDDDILEESFSDEEEEEVGEEDGMLCNRLFFSSLLKVLLSAVLTFSNSWISKRQPRR